MSTAGKKIVRVFMVDGTTKHGLMIDENTSAAQLINTVAKKINLHDESHFALFEVKGDEERCLTPEEKPVAIAERWSHNNPSLKSSDTNVSPGEPRFVFKKKIFVRDEDEQDIKDYDKVAKHMLYIQALQCVIEGEYPCSVDDAVRLAALQAQVIYGDHNPASHVPGFFGQNVSSFIPKPLLPQKQVKEWESLIFKAHANKKGLPDEEAEGEYLSIVKAWSYYGTKYFKNCRVISKNKNLPPKVMIGINVEGIVLANSKEKLQQYANFSFTDLLSWTATPNGAQGTFSFEHGTANDATKYTFETRHADAINDLVQSYVDVLIQMIKLDIGNETVSPRE